MKIVPSFLFQFCFKGEKTAKIWACERESIIIYWKDKKRHIAFPCSDGVACFLFDNREEVFLFYDFLKGLEGRLAQNSQEESPHLFSDHQLHLEQ